MRSRLGRPNYADVFHFSRTLNVRFYTSNIAKLHQAQIVFNRYGFYLNFYRARSEPYDEEHELGTEGLLRRAIDHIVETFGYRSIFFVEDTSLRIESLSNENDYPGVRVKEWFERTNFWELDGVLRARGNDRRVVVKSDIALHIPILSHPIFFHGESSGQVAATQPDFEENPQYRWLSPNNFNGWFIPDGASKRLGEMEFEESMVHDFRVHAFYHVISRLKEYNAIASLTAPHFSVRQQSSYEQIELPLIGDERRLIIVIGDKCAGKTTFGDHALQRFGMRTIEASIVFRNLLERLGGEAASSSEALKFLQQSGMDLVSQDIWEIIADWEKGGVVVTGLRTIEEVQYLASKYPSCELIYVEADARTRFFRHMRRARDEEVVAFSSFEDMDEEQREFGLIGVGSHLADTVIHNVSDLKSYQDKISDAVVGRRRSASARRVSRVGRQSSEVVRSLLALRSIGRAADCDEISRVTKDFGPSVKRYNTNRALKSVPTLAQRIERRGKLLQYRLNDAGKLFLEVLERRR